MYKFLYNKLHTRYHIFLRFLQHRPLAFVVFLVYVLSYFLHILFFAYPKASFAEDPLHKTQLVVVLVDKQLYPQIENDVEWYATQYIQKRLDNSKALVIPVQVTGDNALTAPQLVQMLENIYFDGIKGESSQLVGLVLLGDVPFPVVAMDNFVYPSVYPYVDFERQQFVYDDARGYFVFNGETKAQPEIWHGYIAFDAVNQYHEFFDKLQNYAQDPTNYADRQIWYDDFVALKQYYNADLSPYYVNNFLFLEDLGYQRYTNLMLDMMQGAHNEAMEEKIGGLGGEVDPAVLEDGVNERGAAFGAFGQAAQDNADNVANATSGGLGAEDIELGLLPTLLLRTSIGEFVKGYDDLVATSFVSDLRKQNLLASNRRYRTLSGGNLVHAVDSHIDKIVQKDSYVVSDFETNYAPLIVEYNDRLEEVLDEKVEEQKYYMKIPMLLNYTLSVNQEKRRKLPTEIAGLTKRRCDPDTERPDIYMNYYFGKAATNIFSAQDFSIFRGTYRNYTWSEIGDLTYQDIQDPVTLSPTDTDDYTSQSVGASSALFSQQVEANRAYNADSSIQEVEYYGKMRIHQNYTFVCSKEFKILWIPLFCMSRMYLPDETFDRDGEKGPDFETVEDFAIRNWGGASVLSLDQDALSQGAFVLRDSYDYKQAWLPIFDIAGSQRVLNPEYDANSYLAMETYGSLIRIADRYGVYPYPKYLGGIPVRFKITKPYSEVEYFSIFNSTVDRPPLTLPHSKVISVEGQKLSWSGMPLINKCLGRFAKKAVYNYRLIDSRVKNTAVTQEDIDGSAEALFALGGNNYSNYQRLLDALVVVETQLDDAKKIIVDAGGLRENLDKIDQELYASRTTLQQFVDLNTTTLENLSSSEIDTWITRLNGAVANSKVQALIVSGRAINEQLLALDNLVDSVDLAQFIGVIKQFSDKDYFLDEWIVDLKANVNGLQTDLAQIHTQLYDRAASPFGIKQRYNAYVRPLDLSNALDLGLAQQRDVLHGLVKSGTVDIGCDSGEKYRLLCLVLKNIVRDHGGDDRLNDFDMLVDDGNPATTGDLDTIISEYYTSTVVIPSGWPDIFPEVSNITLKSFFDEMDQHFAQKHIDLGVQINRTLTALDGLESVEDPSAVTAPSGMSFSTKDRPVDTPRYLTFQGVGGDKVTMVYPNLYQVEVYKQENNKLVLKTVEEIETTIREYLKESVRNYNADLTQQLQDRTSFYNSLVLPGDDTNAFELLGQVSPLAMPNREYQLIDEEYFVDELGDEHIGMIAQLLWYQNMTWPERKATDVLVDDLANTRAGFDINKKIDYVVDTYLKADNLYGNDLWDTTLLPTYRTGAYEVAYINSDGRDYLLNGQLPDLVKNMQLYSQSFSDAQASQQAALGSFVDPDQEKLNTACNIPPNGAVPLSKWFGAFRCWLQDVIKKPAEFSIDYRHAQGPVLGTFLDDLKGSFGSYENQWDAYQNDWDSYDDKWRALFRYTEPNQELEPGSLEVPNTVTVQENVEYLFRANGVGSEEPVSVTTQTLPATQAQSLQDVMSYTKVSLDVVDPRVDNFSGNISISSTRDVGSFFLLIKAFGQECFAIRGVSTNLCEVAYEENNVNVYARPKSFPLSISDAHSAGFSTISVQFCLADQTDICVEKTYDIETLPGVMHSEGLELAMPNDTMMAGASLPMVVNAYDKYDNALGQTLDNYLLTVSDGRLEYQGALATGFVFSQLSNQKFIFKAPNYPTTVNFELSPENSDTLPRIGGEINVVEGKMVVIFSGKIANEDSSIEIKLPNALSEYLYQDQNGVQQARFINYPKLTILLSGLNGDPLSSWVSLGSKGGLVTPGEIQTSSIEILRDGIPVSIPKYAFSARSSFLVQNGRLELYLYPDFNVGLDELEIMIPGLDPIKIPVEIKSADPSQMVLRVDKDVVSVGEKIGGELQISDVWGNIFSEAVNVVLETNGPLQINNSSRVEVAVVGGRFDAFELEGIEPGGQGFLMAYVDTGILPLAQQGPGLAQVLVQDSFVPEENLNVMYLNLFGADWGNQWGYFSTYNKKINAIVADSPKIISATTQLTHPDTLRVSSLVFTQNGLVKLLADVEALFGVGADGKYNYFFDGVGVLSFEQDFVLYSGDLESFSYDAADNVFDDGQSSIMYFAQASDSVISSQEIRDNALFVNGEKVFSPREMYIHEDISVRLGIQKALGYTLWEVHYQEKKIGDWVVWVRSDTFLDGNGDFDYDKIDLFDLAYEVKDGFFSASTNGPRAFALTKGGDAYPSNRLAYNSIESSRDPKAMVGFRGDFKNITLFGGGASVGEATKPFSSHFLINFGDPLVERISDNILLTGTHFDGGIGKGIISSADKTIFNVVDIDFNNDGLQDIVTAYTDGTVRIFKNYGGSQPFMPMQSLMLLAGGIQQIFAGDVDGNGYDDIILHTTRNTVQVYLNDRGVFDVDGYPVCLNTSVVGDEITDSPEDFSDVKQLFFEYMDEEVGVEAGNQEKTLDIVTHDSRGDIKIFYGGTTDGRPNYLSTLKYACDQNRNVAQSTEMKFVKGFGLRVNPNIRILDGSVVHWDGLENVVDDEEQIVLEGLDPEMEAMEPDDGLTFKEIVNLLFGDPEGSFQTATQVDTNSEFFAERTDEFLRYQVSPVPLYPIYEDLDPADIYYVPVGYLTGSDPSLTGYDPVLAYKTYEDVNGDILEEGDEVIVSVVIGNKSKSTTLTYIDQLLGPWYIDRDAEGKPEDFTVVYPSTVNSDVDFYRGLESQAGYHFMIDNLRLAPGKFAVFSYLVRYKSIPTVTIDILDKQISAMETSDGDRLAYDNYNDILVAPVDPCAKALWVLANGLDAGSDYREYDEYYIDTAKLMSEYVGTQQESMANALDGVSTALADLGNAEDVEENPLAGIPGLEGVLEDVGINEFLGGVWDSIVAGEDLNFNAVLNLGGERAQALQEKMDNAINGACKGFTLGGANSCKGLPVPFNVDIFSPGNFNVFGCPIKPTFNGIPLIFAPGTIPPVPPILPVPGPPNFLGGIMKGPGDTFLLWPEMGTIPSMIRVYVTVTLTMQMGVSICFGSMAAGMAAPPVGQDVAGNCIVVAIPLPCNKTEPSKELGPQTKFPAFMIDNGGGTCEKVVPANITRPEPEGGWEDFPDLGLDFSPGPGYVEDMSRLAQYLGSPLQLVASSDSSAYPSPAVPAGSYSAGMINFETVPSEWVGDADSPAIDLGPFADQGSELIVGPKVLNKILGAMKAGIMACVVQGWLDKQILYMLNNLTRMTVSITFPDVTDLFKGFDSLTIDNLQILQDEKDCKTNPQAFACVLKNERNQDVKAGYIQNMRKTQKLAEKADAFKKVAKIAYNTSLKKDTLSTLGAEMSNPFEAVQTLFEEVELVKIEPENIVVKVPMLYGEDLVQYINKMKAWLETNQKILMEWTDFFEESIAFCMKKDDSRGLPTTAEITQQLEQGREGTKRYPVLTDRKEFLTYLVEGGRDIAQTASGTLEIWKFELGEQANPGALGEIVLKLQSHIRRTVSLSEAELAILDDALIATDQELEKLNACMGLFALDANGRSKVKDFIDFGVSASALIDSIRANIEVLEQYKKFPIDLYKWMHVTDRYLSELTAILDDFVGSISRWMNNNAERYASYVDAIVTMIGSIKVWQAFIDLSANWSAKCSTCTADAYDSYSCKLGLLCPDLPVLPIPPFKIPNIFIDFSDIKLGIEIKLPEFSFQPQSFVLPKLPNLPHPPTMEANYNFDAPLGFQLSINMDLLGLINGIDFGSFTLPSFPVLPPPPNLPEIPSFLPAISLKLPVLPPAPQIPDITPEVEIALDIVSGIASILCITKGKIGMVAENAVKSKVEQLTQRTYDVPIFDSFDMEAIEYSLIRKQIQKLKDKLETVVDEKARKAIQELIVLLEAGDAPLYGFDYKIESSVDINFDFDYVLEIVQGIADDVNGYTNKIYVTAQEKINSATESGAAFWDGLMASGVDALGDATSYFSQSINSGLSSVKDMANDRDAFAQLMSGYDSLKKWDADALDKLKDWNPQELECLNGFSDEKLKALEKASYEEINKIRKQCMGSAYAPLVPYQDVKNKLLRGVAYVKQSPDFAPYANGFLEVEQIVTQDANFEANIQDLDAIYRASREIITGKQMEVQALANLIRDDYDVFLKQVEESKIQLVSDDEESYRFGLSLFSAYNDVKELVAQQEDPRLTYVSMHEKEVDGYLKALTGSTPMQLRMTDTEYDAYHSYLLKEKKQVVNVKSLFASVSGNPSNLLAQGQGACATCGQGGSSSSFSLDMSQYAKGVLIDDAEGNKLGVVSSNYYIDEFQNRYYQTDLNNDGEEDLLLWDDNMVYVKYYEQFAYHYGGDISSVSDSHYYVYRDGVSSWEQLKTQVDELGYKEFGTTQKIKVKLYDHYREVKNFVLQGQDFEQLRISWSNSSMAGEYPDAYLLRFNLRVDNFYDNEQSYFDGDSGLKNKQYVLVVSQDAIDEATGFYLDSRDGLYGLIDDFMTGVIVKTVAFDPKRESLSVILTDMTRNWLYAEISALKKITRDDASFWERLFGTNENETWYQRLSPWSNQIVAGRQIIADQEGPDPEITLRRIATDEILSTGFEHEGYVGTYYDLTAFWTDNVAMDTMSITQGDAVLASGISYLSTGIIGLTGLFFTGKTNGKYIFSAADFNGNSSYHEVFLDIKAPQVDIVDINQVTDSTANIVAEIDQDIDEGAVIFEKNRSAAWSYLSGTLDSVRGGYTLDVGQTIVTGAYYNVGNDLAIYNKFGDVVATLNAKNGELIVQSGYQESIDVRLSFDRFVPKIEIFDLAYQEVLFWVTLAPESLVSANSLLGDDLYKLVDLDDESFGVYYGGKALVGSDNVVVLYVSLTGDIYVPQPINTQLYGEYYFDTTQQLVKYRIFDHQGTDKKAILELEIKMKSLL